MNFWVSDILQVTNKGQRPFAHATDRSNSNWGLKALQAH